MRESTGHHISPHDDLKASAKGVDIKHRKGGGYFGDNLTCENMGREAIQSRGAAKKRRAAEAEAGWVFSSAKMTGG